MQRIPVFSCPLSKDFADVVLLCFLVFMILLISTKDGYVIATVCLSFGNITEKVVGALWWNFQANVSNGTRNKGTTRLKNIAIWCVLCEVFLNQLWPGRYERCMKLAIEWGLVEWEHNSNTTADLLTALKGWDGLEGVSANLLFMSQPRFIKLRLFCSRNKRQQSWPRCDVCQGIKERGQYQPIKVKARRLTGGDWAVLICCWRGGGSMRVKTQMMVHRLATGQRDTVSVRSIPQEGRPSLC